jgi:hypothetical protein
MATIAEIRAKEFKPGQEIECTGIYTVTHVKHRPEHQVTCILGQPFPTCKHCGTLARFRLLHAAQFVKNHEDFGG